jgi:phosphoribosylformylglycinamidine synthase
MAIAEAITNIASAAIADISDIRLSANWMAAAGEPGQDGSLYDTVQAIGMELCPDLGIAIPVGKDSLSMKTVWRDETGERRMLAPVSLIVSAFAPVVDVGRSLTPQLKTGDAASRLLLIDLGNSRNRMGGSVFAQVHSQFGGQPADLDSAAQLRDFFGVVQALNEAGLVQSYHDRSDGGLIVTLCEMAFASHCGLEISPGVPLEDLNAFLFTEEPGAVIQVDENDYAQAMVILESAGLEHIVHNLGRPIPGERLRVSCNGETVLDESLPGLQKLWSETSHAVQRLRDNPDCADQELESLVDWKRPGLSPQLTFDPSENPAAPMIATGARPQVAQGTGCQRARRNGCCLRPGWFYAGRCAHVRPVGRKEITG